MVCRGASRVHMRNKAARTVMQGEPLVIVGSPPCTDWSTIMNLNWHKMSPEEQKQRKKVAREHQEFCFRLCKIQIRSRRYFLHEHPHRAASWREDTMEELGAQEDVVVTTADQCAYGLATQGPHVTAPAQKPTKFMTYAPRIAAEPRKRCPNRMTHTKKRHEHVPLMNGCARAAQEYPNRACKAICRGILQQIEADRQGRFLIATLHVLTTQEDSERACVEINDELEIVTEKEDPELISAWDDVSGAELDPQHVCAARMAEMRFIRDMGLYGKVPIAKCFLKTHKAPISTKWIDINKGDQTEPTYRSRNVARKIARNKQDG